MSVYGHIDRQVNKYNINIFSIRMLKLFYYTILCFI